MFEFLPGSLPYAISGLILGFLVFLIYIFSFKWPNDQKIKESDPIEEKSEPDAVEINDIINQINQAGTPRGLQSHFDIQCCLSITISPFGNLGDGPLIGRSAKFIGRDTFSPIINLPQAVDLYGICGNIIGDLGGRVIIETDYGFLGWLNPDQFELIFIVNPLQDKQIWLH